MKRLKYGSAFHSGRERRDSTENHVHDRPLKRNAQECQLQKHHCPPKTGSGHVRILIGLASGVLAGLVANVGQQPDLGGGIIQQYFGGVASIIDRVCFESDPGGRTQFIAWLVSVAGPIGKLFLRLMQMMVLPLVVSALFLAVVDVGDVRKLGRIGLTTLFYTAILSISAVLIGITLVNVVQPGRTISPAIRDSLKENMQRMLTKV